MIAAAGDDGVYVSTNSGSSWSLTPLLRHQFFWSALAASADGTKLIAAAGNGGVCISTNSGVDWIQTSLPSSISNYWPIVTSSADGCTLAAVSDVNNFGLDEFVGGPIYVSTNAGETWVPTATNEWRSLAMSLDGTELVAASENSIYLSTNSGNDWTLVNTPLLQMGRYFVHCSFVRCHQIDDCKHQLAVSAFYFCFYKSDLYFD